ncbi:22519_t:CDS:1, partial [Gigaspora margarita]
NLLNVYCDLQNCESKLIVCYDIHSVIANKISTSITSKNSLGIVFGSIILEIGQGLFSKGWRL